MSSASRVAAYRERQRQAGKPDSSRANRGEDRKRWKRINRHEKQWQGKPFVGCDGEGCGKDEFGRQQYYLFRAGELELYTGRPLRTVEILDAICATEPGTILVGFAFGYDVTMILRDVSPAQQEKLFAPKEFGPGKSRFVWYKNFDIEYLPKQYFRVRKVNIIRGDNGKEKRIPIKGSVRTIYETFGFFQKSFLKTIESFEIGTEQERKSIAANKARRSDFSSIDQEERDYCALECRMLAELMEKLREYCFAAGIRPKSWNGAGKLASALHSLHETIERSAIEQCVPSGLLDFANMAYYGGRFEITRHGMIGSKVFEYDIRSAYPDAMRNLPCLIHGNWKQFKGSKAPPSSLYVAALAFNHVDTGHGQMCGFPIRSKEGHLYWPLQGSGIYWSCEIEAAKLLGATVKLKGGWYYEKLCDCQPFEWVEPLFDYRRSIGSSGPGYPIKLGINSLYGKLAQRKGAGKYTNMVHAGLITAFTRAKLMKAMAQAPGDICMVATDAVYSLKPLNLPCGDKLGEWEAEALEDLFIVQPGLYWSPDRRKRKSRGLPGKFFEEAERTQSFESAWRNWMELGGDLPETSVPMQNFIGLKLALARGKPETAGVWKDETRNISFDYRNKREGFVHCAGHICTGPRFGGNHVVSLPHKDFIKSGGQEPWENARLMFEEQPDYIDLGPPFMD